MTDASLTPRKPFSLHYEDDDYEDSGWFDVHTEKRTLGSAAASWLAKGAGIGAILSMVLGPVGFIVGGCIGGLLSLVIGFIYDKCRFEKSTKEADEKKERLVQLLRWAEYVLPDAEDPAEIFVYVVLEFQGVLLLAKQNDFTEQAVKRFRDFLERNEVQECAMSCVENFFGRWRLAEPKEIAICQAIMQTCVETFKDLKRTPQVYKKMEELLRRSQVKRLFGSVAEENNALKKQALKRKDWLIFADMPVKTQEVFRQDFGRRFLRRKSSASLAGGAHLAGQEDPLRLDSYQTVYGASPGSLSLGPSKLPKPPAGSLDRKEIQRKQSPSFATFAYGGKPPHPFFDSGLHRSTSLLDDRLRRGVSADSVPSTVGPIDSEREHPARLSHAITIGSVDTSAVRPMQPVTALIPSTAEATVEPRGTSRDPLLESSSLLIDISAEPAAPPEPATPKLVYSPSTSRPDLSVPAPEPTPRPSRAEDRFEPLTPKQTRLVTPTMPPASPPPSPRIPTPPARGSVVLSPPPPGPDAVQPSVAPTPKAPEEKRMFESFQDLANFQPELKHKVPVAMYEFEFLEDFVKEDRSDKSWDIVTDKKDTRVYKRIIPVRGSDLVIIKGYATLKNISPDVVLWNIRDTPRRTAWDTTFEGFTLVEGNVFDNEVVYNSIRAPWPVANRDFLQWRRTIIDSKNNVIKILHRSAEHPGYPEPNGQTMIRGESIISAYIIKGSEGGRSTELFLITQTDIRGSIPRWLVNSTAAKAPAGWIENLRKACLESIKKYGANIPAYVPQPMYENGIRVRA